MRLCPELGVLDKDFTIYSVTNSYQTNIVNGQVSQQRQWQIGLVPKGVAGTAVTVPADKIGKCPEQSGSVADS